MQATSCQAHARDSALRVCVSGEGREEAGVRAKTKWSKRHPKRALMSLLQPRHYRVHTICTTVLWMCCCQMACQCDCQCDCCLHQCRATPAHFMSGTAYVERLLAVSDNFGVPVSTQLPRKDGCACTATWVPCSATFNTPTANSIFVQNEDIIS